MQEQPYYVLKQDKKRALIPKFITLIFLSSIFYIGILLNISLLDLRAQEETIIKITTLIVITFLIALGFILAILRSHKTYSFYHTHLSFGKKSKPYQEIKEVIINKDFIDKIFKTYSINLGNHFHLRHLPQNIDIKSYLEKILRYTNS